MPANCALLGAPTEFPAIRFSGVPTSTEKKLQAETNKDAVLLKDTLTLR